MFSAGRVMGEGGKTNAAEQITAARMPQKGTTLRGKKNAERYGKMHYECTMLLQSPDNSPTIPRLWFDSTPRSYECINWRANAKAKAELQNRIKTITRDMKTDLKNWMETHSESEPDTLELVVKCID